jgi:hypothetical protein
VGDQTHDLDLKMGLLWRKMEQLPVRLRKKVTTRTSFANSWKLSPQARPERIIQTRIDNFVWPFIGDRNLGNCTVPIAVDGTATGKVPEIGCCVSR